MFLAMTNFAASVALALTGNPLSAAVCLVAGVGCLALAVVDVVSEKS